MASCLRGQCRLLCIHWFGRGKFQSHTIGLPHSATPCPILVMPSARLVSFQFTSFKSLIRYCGIFTPNGVESYDLSKWCELLTHSAAPILEQIEDCIEQKGSNREYQNIHPILLVIETRQDGRMNWASATILVCHGIQNPDFESQ